MHRRRMFPRLQVMFGGPLHPGASKNFAPPGNGSVTTTLVAVEGPLFFTEIASVAAIRRSTDSRMPSS